MAKGLGSSFQLPVEYRTRLEGQEAARWHRDRLLERAGEGVAAVRSYLSATASQAQHYFVSTPLKFNTFCASLSTLLTLNNLVFNNNEFNTTSIQQHSILTNFLQQSHIQHFYIQQSHIQQSHFQQSHFQQSHIKNPLHSIILVFNTSWIQHFFFFFKMYFFSFFFIIKKKKLQDEHFFGGGQDEQNIYVYIYFCFVFQDR